VTGVRVCREGQSNDCKTRAVLHSDLEKQNDEMKVLVWGNSQHARHFMLVGVLGMSIAVKKKL
jgi:hypothetical protein